MFRKLALTALVLTGCTLDHAPVSSQSSAIIGGTLDPSGDPGVVMIYATIGTGTSASGAICTGEVVSPHMVLTAAHCVDPDVLGDVQGWVVYLGDNVNSDMEVGTPGNVIDVTSTDFDQSFDKNELQNGHDIGEVTTATAIPLTPLVVNQTALSQSDVGDAIHLVGYGITKGTDSTGATAGVRHQTDNTVAVVDTTDKTFSFDGSTKITCEGDSGGAAFTTKNGVKTVIGTTSYGTTGCTDGGTDTDVGAYYTSWILPHITAAESGAAAADMSGPGSTSDLAGVSTADFSSPLAPTNTVDSGTSSTNPNGFPLGQACQASSECESGVCTLGSSHYCTQACELNVDTSCPSTMKCEEVGGSPYCVIPTKSSGCSATAGSAPGSSGALGGIILLLAVALGLRFVPRRP